MKALALLLVLSATAAAQDQRALARQKFEDGRLEFSAGRYDSALSLFRESYQLAPYPALLFNIARCHEQLHQYRRALDAYEHYLAVTPQDNEARARADEMRQLAATEPPSPEPSPSAPAQLTVVVAPPPPPLTPPPPAPAPVYKKWWLWTAVVGVAAVTLGVGLGVGLSGADPQRTFPPLSAR